MSLPPSSRYGKIKNVYETYFGGNITVCGKKADCCSENKLSIIVFIERVRNPANVLIHHPYNGLFTFYFISKYFCKNNIMEYEEEIMLIVTFETKYILNDLVSLITTIHL